MTLPCGHDDDEHQALREVHNRHAREEFTGWLIACTHDDPSNWRDALTTTADLMVADLHDCDVLDAWRDRVADWSEPLLVTLIIMGATALDVAHVDLGIITREGARLSARWAATAMSEAVARQRGLREDGGHLGELIARLTDWEALCAVHFGRSALLTIGLGPADLLALVDVIPTDANGA